LLIALESRLDNLVYRMGFATSRRAARQLVRHRHIQVNGSILDVPSYRVKPGEEVKVADGSRENVHILGALEHFGRGQPVPWISVDTGKAVGRMTERPTRDTIPIAAQEQAALRQRRRGEKALRRIPPAADAAAQPVLHLVHAIGQVAENGRHDQQHTGHAEPSADGSARAQLSKLYFGRLDGSDTPRALTGGVCYCCKTAVAAGPDGSLFAAWRHVYPGNVRDIAFTVSRDGGRTFAAPLRVSDDRWVLDGCPENGPAMAVDGRNRVHMVWPTLVSGSTPGSEPTLALFYAASSDGRQFTARERITTEGLPRHPQIAIDSRGSVVAAWDEQVKGTRRVVVGRAVVGMSDL
jgi:ribosomal 50S subunit-recycling heat shock protein